MPGFPEVGSNGRDRCRRTASAKNVRACTKSELETHNAKARSNSRQPFDRQILSGIEGDRLSMKNCPTCKRTYDDDSLRFCLDDGTNLSSSLDRDATQRMPGRHREAAAARRKQADTIQSSAPVTDRWPPAAPLTPAQPQPKEGGLSKRWPLLLIPVFVLVLIPVVVAGIWFVVTIVKGGGSQRKWLALLARGQVNTSQVVRETTAEIVSNPRNALALRARSGAYYVSNEFNQGRRDAEEVERLLESASTAEEYEARCYARWRLGKPDPAVSDCTRAIELDKSFVWPYHNRANAYNDKGSFQNALADWNKAIQLDAKFAPAYNNRGNYYMNIRDYDRAIEDFSKALEIDPQYATVYSSRGNVYSYKGQADKALADYNRNIELDPRDARPYNFRGQLYFQRNDYDRAMSDYNKAIELNPRFAWAFNNRGNVFYFKGQKDRALADYIEAINLDPNWSWAYQSRASVYYDRKDYDRAIADYDKAIELNPQLAWSYNGRGLSYYNKGNLDQAIADYNKAIEISPQESAFYNNRGVVYYYRKDYSRAIEDYTKAIQIDPRYAMAYGNRANAYQALGDQINAAADRDKVNELKK